MAAKNLTALQTFLVFQSDSYELQKTDLQSFQLLSFVYLLQISPDEDNPVPFSVVTYNILSEVIRKKHDKEYHAYTEEKYLDLRYRHKRIIQELRYLDPDIVCLQEVDGQYFKDTLQPDMKR